MYVASHASKAPATTLRTPTSAATPATSTTTGNRLVQSAVAAPKRTPSVAPPATTTTSAATAAAAPNKALSQSAVAADEVELHELVNPAEVKQTL